MSNMRRQVNMYDGYGADFPKGTPPAFRSEHCLQLSFRDEALSGVGLEELYQLPDAIQVGAAFRGEPDAKLLRDDPPE